MAAATRGAATDFLIIAKMPPETKTAAGGKEPEGFRDLRHESHGDQGARERKDVKGSPGRGFGDRRARRRLEHEVFGDQR